MVKITTDKKHRCWICGENFLIRVRIKDRKIISKCFYSRLSKHFFLNWVYGWEDETVYFNNTFWKIIGYTKLQRWIIYKIWYLFKGWQKIDYYECKNCCSK